MPAPQLVVTPQARFIASENQRNAFVARLLANIGQAPFSDAQGTYRFYLTHLLDSDGKLHESSDRFLAHLQQIFGADAEVEIQHPVELMAGLKELPQAEE